MTDQEFIQKYHDLENRIEQLEVVINKTKTDSEPEFKRVEQGKEYYHVEMGCDVCINSLRDDTWYDETSYNNNNYFHTKERAQEVRDKIKFLLKLERLHDIYCPDYKPDWSNSENKYLILYSHTTNRYVVGNAVCIEPSLPCFPTKEIAQKVCDALNKELQ